MYAYALVGSTICDTCIICKIQENANITNRTSVAQIELSKIEHSICDTQLLFAKHGHTNMHYQIVYLYSTLVINICMYYMSRCC